MQCNEAIAVFEGFLQENLSLELLDTIVHDLRLVCNRLLTEERELLTSEVILTKLITHQASILEVLDIANPYEEQRKLVKDMIKLNASQVELLNLANASFEHGQALNEVNQPAVCLYCCSHSTIDCLTARAQTDVW